jgi:hypothetical protein
MIIEDKLTISFFLISLLILVIGFYFNLNFLKALGIVGTVVMGLIFIGFGSLK